MNTLRRIRYLALAAVPLVLCPLACTSRAVRSAPEIVCGTRIDPALTHLLVTSTEEFHEFNRVDREEAITAPCVLLAGREPALEFQFSWDEVAADLMYLATGNGTVSHVNQPRSSNLAAKAIVGTDGSIATAPCKTKRGNYFTLTLQIPRIKLTDQSHRGDIEKFMRAYFPATVETLGCS
ncbi:hypothetical protein [Streptomyces sp. Caat 7-52]|uniref:hypothetical protein n=1 Tax=Streptomyces sp. Caat 7-52 TaxID=2949637 RepID=UPI002034FBD1|nr:hypothetical protein [Streptomyces sp. Caat 7-52]